MLQPNETQISMDLAGLAIDVVTRSAAATKLCSSRYSAFLSSPDAPAREPDLTIDLTLGANEAFAEFAEASDLRVMNDSPGIFSFARADYFGTLDLASHRAQVTCTKRVYSLNSCVRVLCAVTLAREGGFLVHASSVERGGRAYLFVGRSGAGKTTIARLCTSGRVLSDEISAVRRAGKRFHCFSTPFWGDLVPTREESVSAPIAGLFFPVQAAQPKRVPLSPAQAATQLLESIVVFGEDPSTVAKVLDTSCAFARETESALLHFRPDPSVWECIGA